MLSSDQQMEIVRKVLRCGVTFGVLLGASLGRLNAQVLPETMPQRGLVAGEQYAISDLETINTVNGNVFYRIPLASLPPGRAGFSSGVNLTYNSEVYDIRPVSGGSVIYEALATSQWGGWQYGYMYRLNLDQRPNLTGSYNCIGTADNWKLYRLSVISPDGSHHTLHLYPNTPSNPAGWAYSDYQGDGFYETDPAGQTNGCSAARPPSGDLTYSTSDGSYLKVVVGQHASTNWADHPWTIYFPDGGTATGKGGQMDAITDHNGNTITITNYAEADADHRCLLPPCTVLADGLNRYITITYSESPDISSTDKITQSGYSEDGSARTLTTTVNWTHLDMTGSTLKYICSSQGNSCQANMDQRVVSSIDLPTPKDNSVQRYIFGYADNTVSGWGELNDVTFPSGAKVHYHYSEENQWKADIAYLTEDPISSKVLTWIDDFSHTETTSYSFTSSSSQITNPDGGIITNYFYDRVLPAGMKGGLVFRVSQPDGSTLERTWYQNRSYGSQANDPGNPYVKNEFRSVAAGGSPVQANVKVFGVDKNGNRVGLSEYDWIPYSSITRDNYQAPATFSSTSGAVRTTSNSYNSATATAGDGTESISDNTNAYWNPGSPAARNLLATNSTSGIGSASQATFAYGDASGHPNLVTEQHWDSATSTWLTTNYTYDPYGNRASVQNPRGYTTTYTYDSSNCMTHRVLGTSPTLRNFTYTCDPDRGLVTSELDSDHAITRVFGYDRFGRNTLISEGGMREKDTTYSDGIRMITVASDLKNNQDHALVQTTLYDQLGGTWQTSDPAGSIVQTRNYTPPAGQSGAGFSYRAVSSPYITQAESTMGWTRSKFDPNGRLVEVQHFSGSGLPAPWVSANSNSTGTATTSYSSNTTITQDEAGVSRTSITDGLGRLGQVTENGIGATTTYSYDALDDLTGVTQGSQTRTFVYSSLRRLTSATNPESGVTSYTYDANGNVATRTSRGITTSYTYDGLDELTGKTYNDSGVTPAASYSYDHGWRTSASSGNTVYGYTTFDGLGRVTLATQTTGGQAYTFGYEYNLADGIKKLTLPSGRVVTTTYDATSGRPSTVQGALSGVNTNYVTSLTYAPQGAVQQMALGNGVTVGTAYNSLLQPTQIQAGSLWTLGYGYAATTNNGNVASQTLSTAGNTFQSTYGYDGANRLSSASESVSGSTTWSENFGYDNVGNRWVSAAAPAGLETAFTPTVSTNFDTGNHLLVNGSSYDGAGNQHAIGGYVFTYDAENRLTSSTIGGAAATYAYDGDSHRITKVTPSGTTTYVYDAFGQLAAEYSTVANTATGTQYLTADALGSTRLVIDSSGTVKARYDYLPFGEELQAGIGGRTTAMGYSSTPDSFNLKFSGKERDSETNLDYFGARYMSSAQGRFISPDPILLLPQKLLDPQQWNMYSYVRNNPLSLLDPTGMYVTDCADGDKKCNKRIDNFEKARQKDLKSKDEAVRNAAASYGDRDNDNGVTVHVVSGQQMQEKYGVIANGITDPQQGEGGDRVDIYINQSLSGKDLQRTIAHEGAHLEDDMAFIQSYDYLTGKYSQTLNVTHGQTEFNGFSTGAAVKKYEYGNVTCGAGPCIFGPHDAVTIHQFLQNSKAYGPVLNLPVFDPKTWKQQ
jgi:RHS repeat-associated protein